MLLCCTRVGTQQAQPVGTSPPPVGQSACRSAYAGPLLLLLLTRTTAGSAVDNRAGAVVTPNLVAVSLNSLDFRNEADQRRLAHCHAFRVVLKRDWICIRRLQTQDQSWRVVAQCPQTLRPVAESLEV